MKYLSLITLFIFSSLATLKAQDEQFTHFRGLEIGDYMYGNNLVMMDSGYEELVYHGTQDNIMYYFKEHEDLSIGTANLEMIFYLFDKDGKFRGVQFEGYPKSKDDMLFILENKFGKSPLYYQNKEVNYHQWYTENGVHIKFYENEDDDFIVYIINEPMSPENKEINQEVTDF